MAQCPQCGATVNRQDAVCDTCGASLTERGTQEAREGREDRHSQRGGARSQPTQGQQPTGQPPSGQPTDPAGRPRGTGADRAGGGGTSRRKLLLLAGGAVTLVAGGVYAATQLGSGGPEATVKKFFEAFGEGDVSTVNSLIHPDSPIGRLPAEQIRSASQYDFSVVSVEVIDQTDTQATVTVEIASTQSGVTRTSEATLQLRKAGDRWLIYSLPEIGL